MAKAPKTAKTAAEKKPRGRPPAAAKEPKAPKAAKAPKAEKAPRASQRTEINAEDKALFLQHLPKIADLKAKLNTANSNLRTAYRTAKAEGFHKVDFDSAFELQTAEGEKKRKSAIIRNLTIARWLGLDLGEQLDMFAEPSRVPAEDRAKSEGESAAMLGKSANPPYDPSTPQYRAWMDAWHATQASMIKDGIKPTEDKPGLITAAQKEEAEKVAAEQEAARKNAVPTPVTSGVAMTRAQFKAQQQSGGGGSARAEAEKLFKKVASPAT